MLCMFYVWYLERLVMDKDSSSISQSFLKHKIVLSILNGEWLSNGSLPMVITFLCFSSIYSLVKFGED